MREVGRIVTMSEADYADWFQRRVVTRSDGGFYCLLFNLEDTPIGEVSYRLIDPAKRMAAQNIKIHARHRRKGNATDGLLHFLDHAFNRHGIHRMSDEIAIYNTVAQDFFIRLGFVHYPSKSQHFWVEMDRESFNMRYKTANGKWTFGG